MNDVLNDLQRKWEDDKKNKTVSSSDVDELMQNIAVKKRANLYFYYGNIFIIALVLIGVSLFFYFVAPVEEILSRIGAGLMIVGLAVRIVIEGFSIAKAKKIDAEVNTLEHTNSLITFHRFRKFIHGPVTLTIVGLYTIGFYLISPEFSLYLSFWNMVLIDSSYVLIAIVLIFVIRNAIKKEMKTLNEIIQLKQELQE